MLGKTEKPNGSSPRVRGTRGPHNEQAAAARFIPARAGNASVVVATVNGFPVHPRACGERWLILRHPLGITGSSPRVRGTLPRGRDKRIDARFIPARAGNAYSSCVVTAIISVHPRACGERCGQVGYKFGERGSSPRVRGTLPVTVPSAIVVRFIPARAGNAAINVARSILTPVHPRACGERKTTHGAYLDVTGSSPRVRGTLARRHQVQLTRRFIPARAGNAWAPRLRSA